MTEQKIHPIFTELDSPLQEGFIRVKKPSLLVFPAGCQGDSSLLCVDSYNALIDGGNLEKPTFWRLIRHHLSLDCLLSTTATAGSLVGINKFLERKIQERDLKLPVDCNSEEYKKLLQHLISPDLGAYFTNYQLSIASENTSNNEDLCAIKKNIKLTKELNLKVRSLAFSAPITLFMKFEVGKLVMYPLLPASSELGDNFNKFKTNKEVKSEKQLNKENASVGCLLVWFPENPKESIVRILFPGNCTQENVLNALNNFKNAEFLRYAEVTSEKLEERKKAEITALDKKPKKTAQTKPQATLIRKTKAGVNRTNTRSSLTLSRQDKRSVANLTTNKSTLTTTRTKQPATKQFSNSSSSVNMAKISNTVGEKNQRPSAARRPSSAIVTKKPTKTLNLTNRPSSARPSATTTMKKLQSKPLRASRPSSASKTPVKKSTKSSSLSLKNKLSNNKQPSSKVTSKAGIKNITQSLKGKQSISKTVEVSANLHNKEIEDRKSDVISEIAESGIEVKLKVKNLKPTEENNIGLVRTSPEGDDIKKDNFDETKSKSMNNTIKKIQDCRENVSIENSKEVKEKILKVEDNQENKFKEFEENSRYPGNIQSVVEMQITPNNSDFNKHDVLENTSSCNENKTIEADALIKLNPFSQPFIPLQVAPKEEISKLVIENSEEDNTQKCDQLILETNTTNDKFIETHILQQQSHITDINEKLENITPTEHQKIVSDEVNIAENCSQILEDKDQKKNLEEVKLLNLVEDEPEKSWSIKDVISLPVHQTNTDFETLQNKTEYNQQLLQQSELLNREKIKVQHEEEFVFGTKIATKTSNEYSTWVDDNGNSIKESQPLADIKEREKNNCPDTNKFERNLFVDKQLEQNTEEVDPTKTEQKGKSDVVKDKCADTNKFEANLFFDKKLEQNTEEVDATKVEKKDVVKDNRPDMNKFDVNLSFDKQLEQNTEEVDATKTEKKDKSDVVKDLVLEASNKDPDEKFILEDNTQDPMMPVNLKSSIRNSNNHNSKEKKTITRSTATPISKLVYVDLTYVPHHGNPDYVGELFFKQVRSKYYVLGGVSDDEVNNHTLDGLLRGIKIWNDPENRKDTTNITIIPTRDSPILRNWFNSNYNELENINVHMVSSACKIFMHNETVEACKIEF